MPLENLVGEPTVIPPVEFFWPWPSVAFTQTVFAGTVLQGANLGKLDTINPTVWGAGVGAGGQQVLTIRDVLTWQILTPFQKGIDASLVFPVALFDSGAYPAGFELPDWIRCQIFDIWIMLSDNVTVAGDECGLIFQGNNSGTPWPTFSGNGSFGIVCDDIAGGWQYTNFAPGGAYPANVAERVASPTVLDRSVLTRFTFEFTSASVGRDASMRLLVNGVPWLTRAWVGAGSLLPPYVGNETQWRPAIRVNAGALHLHTAYMRWRYGKFTATGEEVRF